MDNDTLFTIIWGSISVIGGAVAGVIIYRNQKNKKG